MKGLVVAADVLHGPDEGVQLANGDAIRGRR